MHVSIWIYCSFYEIILAKMTENKELYMDVFIVMSRYNGFVESIWGAHWCVLQYLRWWRENQNLIATLHFHWLCIHINLLKEIKIKLVQGRIRHLQIVSLCLHWLSYVENKRIFFLQIMQKNSIREYGNKIFYRKRISKISFQNEYFSEFLYT